MQFVKAAVLKSTDGVYATERRTRHVAAQGVDYFSNRDAFVSEENAQKKHHYQAEIEERGGHRTWRASSNVEAPPADADEGNGNEYAPATVTQDEYEFLQNHQKRKKRQEIANRQAVEEFHQIKANSEPEETFLSRLAHVQRYMEKEKTHKKRISMKSQFGGLIIKKKGGAEAPSTVEPACVDCWQLSLVPPVSSVAAESAQGENAGSAEDATVVGANRRLGGPRQLNDEEEGLETAGGRREEEGAGLLKDTSDLKHLLTDTLGLFEEYESEEEEG